jgi:hypothetical protein
LKNGVSGIGQSNIGGALGSHFKDNILTSNVKKLNPDDDILHS